MSFDHGTLNIPLSKRGNIDSQIDAFKAEQATRGKVLAQARHAEAVADRAESKRLLAAITDDRLAALATRCNVSKAAMRTRLKSDAHWQPKLVIALLSSQPAA